MRRRQLATSDAGAIVGTPLGLMGLGGRPASSPWACVVPTSLRVDAWAGGDCIELIKMKKKNGLVCLVFLKQSATDTDTECAGFFLYFFFFRPPLPATARHGVSRLPGSLSLTYGVDTSVYLWRRVPVQFFFFRVCAQFPVVSTQTDRRASPVSALVSRQRHSADNRVRAAWCLDRATGDTHSPLIGTIVYLARLNTRAVTRAARQRVSAAPPIWQDWSR